MFIEFLQVYLPIVIYLLLIILLVVGIIIGVKAIRILDMVEKVAEDIDEKLQSLGGLFSLVDFVTDKFATITETLTNGVTGLLGKFFNKKNKIKKEEE